MREQGKWSKALGPTGASLAPQVIGVLPWRRYCPVCLLDQQWNPLWTGHDGKKENKALKNKAEIQTVKLL